jgi:NitT/TauT family transport system ATP-binding protein
MTNKLTPGSVAPLADSDAPLIIASDLSMTFGDQSPTLAELNLAVARGEFVSIVGPSGCGKSTLLRLVAGLRKQTVGRLTVDGQSPENSSVRNAFVFQEPNLLPWRTVEQNIRLPFELDQNRSESDADIEAGIRRAIKLIGLTEADARKRPRQLSGGMRMRVSLARALVTDPDILLLDEPFAALDDMLRQQLNEDLQCIWSERRWTALFVTHNVSEAVFLSQRVLVMSRNPGRLIADIPVPFDSPREPSLRSTPEFARLVGDVSTQLRAAATDLT